MQDSVIKSLVRLYLVLFTFFSIYLLVAWRHLEFNAATESLLALDRLLTVRFVANNQPLSGPQITELKLADYFTAVASEQFQMIPDDPENPNRNFNPKVDHEAITDDPVPGTQVMASRDLHAVTRTRCDLLITGLPAGHSFNFATFQFRSRIFNVPSDKTFVLSFPTDCGRGGEFHVVVFFDENNEVAIALPASFESEFPGLSPQQPFRSFPFSKGEIEILKGLLPAAIRRVIDLDESYVILHMRAIEQIIVNFAVARSGKRYFTNGVEGAVHFLYEEQEPATPSLLGFSTSSALLLRYGPLFYIWLIFAIWRRARLLKPKETETFWFGNDSGDLIGRFYGYLVALFPILAGGVIAGLYASVHQNYLNLFGRMITPVGLFTWSFPRAPPDPQFDYGAIGLVIVGALLFPALVEICSYVINFIVFSRSATTTVRHRVSLWQRQTLKRKARDKRR